MWAEYASVYMARQKCWLHEAFRKAFVCKFVANLSEITTTTITVCTYIYKLYYYYYYCLCSTTTVEFHGEDSIILPS